ncbi:ANTAR domain-containing protein [Amycolatopsis solani]|uniref:ANTAR domain-containing protein n=1 Tax=Amycolatopsis solani TaxID=3028615 RepID=UPI0025AF0617|nr:ANTAR domain-containing protein [Amycolatopsis sp. MEP2-6]
MKRAPLDRLRTDPAFQAAPAPYLILDPDLRIRAANPAYAQATLTSAADLHGTYLFDAFPDNPADPGADGVANLSGSLERVLRAGHRHYMGLQRYDVPAPDDRAKFVHKVWAPVNVPLRDPDNRIAGILHHVEDVTHLQEALTDPVDPDAAHRRPLYEAAQALAQLQDAHDAVLQENSHLREALQTRGRIEQAKGILIGQRGCSADEAFQILVELSQHSNTKLHEVAQAFIDDTISGG